MNYAQSLSPNIINSAGGSIQGNGMELQWSIGQSGTKTVIEQDFILTEGFQQPYSTLTSVIDPKEFKSFSVFPNPTTGNLTVSVLDNQIKINSCYIVNTSGKMVLFRPMDVGVQSLNIDVSHFECGVYFLFLKDENLKVSNSYSFIKILHP